MSAAGEREIGRRSAVQRREPQDVGGRSAAPAHSCADAQKLFELTPIVLPFGDETLYLHGVQYEDRISIATPEGVALEFTLAGIGSRAVAGGIDLIFKGLLVGLLLIVLLAAFGSDGALVIVPAIGLTLLLYDVGFETLRGGRTPGKSFVGLRVVRSGGRSVDLSASMIRNVLRLVDGITLGYLPTIVSIAATSRNQRPGDLAADTVVIRDRRAIDAEQPGFADRSSRARIDSSGSAAGASWDVSSVPVADLATVRAFLERRDSLAREARARLAAQLDGALRPRVGGAEAGDPEQFLEILYDASRERG